MPADNVARERLNQLIRQEYGRDHLFDLAARRVHGAGRHVGPAGTHEGQPYFRLYDGYASDNGHLNDGVPRSRPRHG